MWTAASALVTIISEHACSRYEARWRIDGCSWKPQTLKAENSNALRMSPPATRVVNNYNNAGGKICDEDKWDPRDYVGTDVPPMSVNEAFPKTRFWVGVGKTRVSFNNYTLALAYAEWFCKTNHAIVRSCLTRFGKNWPQIRGTVHAGAELACDDMASRLFLLGLTHIGSSTRKVHCLATSCVWANASNAPP